jgi:3-methylfumaryl-CoA hydratase
MAVASAPAAVPVDIADLRKHIGRRVEEHDVATAAPMHGLVVTFDRAEKPPVAGEPVPPGWHHAYFLAMSRKATLGADGLPTESNLLPKMPFPRRMFAGVRMTFHMPIRVGEAIRRESELTDIQLREGATGRLIFTTQVRKIFGPKGLYLTEEYDGVFREEVAAGSANPVTKRDAVPDGLPWKRQIEADVVSLFRFSALTFNPHRIHYDRTYATTVEGYPGLVVHGPYSQQCLMDFARDMHPGRTMTSFHMRARAPLFDTAPFTVTGRPGKEPGSAELWAVTPEGTIAMQATATFG